MYIARSVHAAGHCLPRHVRDVPSPGCSTHLQRGSTRYTVPWLLNTLEARFNQMYRPLVAQHTCSVVQLDVLPSRQALRPCDLLRCNFRQLLCTNVAPHGVSLLVIITSVTNGRVITYAARDLSLLTAIQANAGTIL
jgi:hypothetical protein